MSTKGILELEHFYPLSWLKCFASCDEILAYSEWLQLNHWSNLSLWKNTINYSKLDLILMERTWKFDESGGRNVPSECQSSRQQAVARRFVLEQDAADTAEITQIDRRVVFQRRNAEIKRNERMKQARLGTRSDIEFGEQLEDGNLLFLVSDVETISLDDRRAIQIAIVNPADTDAELNSESLVLSFLTYQHI